MTQPDVDRTAVEEALIRDFDTLFQHLGADYRTSPVFLRILAMAFNGTQWTEQSLKEHMFPPTKVRIGYSGIAGSYSAEAAYKWAQKIGLATPEFVPMVEISAVLAAIEAGGNIDYGVFPITNSLIGMIKPALDAIGRYKFAIAGDVDLFVEHCLLARPGLTKEGIKTICSMKPAILQCSQTLISDFSGTPIVEYADTALAAQDLSNGTLSPDWAVIASRQTAELYGLEILISSFQDRGNNMTEFLVVKRCN